MVKVLHILGSCALLAAGAILCRWADERGAGTLEVEVILRGFRGQHIHFGCELRMMSPDSYQVEILRELHE
jgi:hypothetical protein